MSRHRRTVLAVVALAVVAWGAVHLVATPPLAVTPAVWPGAAAAASSPSAAVLPVASPAPSAAPSGGGVPILPAAMQQLNASTESTATGIWTLLQELEAALGERLGTLVGQLEHGR